VEAVRALPIQPGRPRWLPRPKPKSRKKLQAG
jgi:hypothetical protein